MDLINDIENNICGPAQFLVDNISLIPCGRALDIAMGTGRNAIYLAKMGFRVEGVDASSEKIEVALERARMEDVSILAREEDLEKIPYIEEEAYDLVICFNYLQRSLMPQIKNWVKTGGTLMYETYTIDQQQLGKPKSPDHLLKHNELLHTFQDFCVVRYREGIIGGKRAIASIIAQKI
jgi:2-polyprenyl-3-methyl-5-hydroxy-6-metoxy-1,4-benzoquinol methylase